MGKKAVFDLKNIVLKLETFLSAPRSPRNIRRIVYTMFASAIVLSAYFLSFPYLAKEFDYKEGDVAKEDIYVYRDVFYEKKEETKKLRQAAYDKQRYIFDRDYEVFKKIVDQLNREFSIFTYTSSTSKEALNTVKEKLPFLKRAKSIRDKDILKALSDRNRTNILEWAIWYMTLVFDHYAILDAPVKGLKKFSTIGAEIRTINTSSDYQESLLWNSEQFIYNKSIFGYKNHGLLSQLPNEGKAKPRKKIRTESQKIVILRVLQLLYRNPYTKYNPSLTKKLKEKARISVQPERSLLKKGLIIVREGDPIDKESHKRIQILNQYHSETNFEHILGIFLIQISIALVIVFYISRFARSKLKDLSSNTILFSLVLIFMLYCFGLSQMSFFQDPRWYLALFVPSGLIGGMGTILLGVRITFCLGIYLSFFIFFISEFQAMSLVLSFVSIVSGIYTASKMEKRIQMLQGSMVQMLTMSLIVVGAYLTSQRGIVNLENQLFLVFINSLVGVSLSFGFIPIYESIFNLPTKFRLLELANGDNHLLKKIVMEAPSTYTHTLMVATLSERAVEAIGGDVLLTKVGCMYHDIGKTISPTFFAENRHLDEKSERFKDLGAYESTKIIIGHVVDGLRLSRQYRLPDKVAAFIPEHHGTTTIQYFYHEALKKAARSKKSKVKKSDFQYPGPKPQSKETAVVMIADSVEAAARSLEDPNKENLTALLDRIVENKLSEDQFDESGITIRDIKLVKESFLDVLINSFHLRPKYPTMEATRSLEAHNTNGKGKLGKRELARVS